MKKHINYICKFISIMALTSFISIIFSCGMCKRQNVKDDYQKVFYHKLINNDNASLEILNQINFINKQLELKESGKPYASTNIKNIITLSKIPAKIIAVGYFGNSYELTRENVSKWRKWYEEYSKFIYYEIIDDEKHIAIKYPNGEKIVLE